MTASQLMAQTVSNLSNVFQAPSANTKAAATENGFEKVMNQNLQNNKQSSANSNYTKKAGEVKVAKTDKQASEAANSNSQNTLKVDTKSSEAVNQTNAAQLEEQSSMLKEKITNIMTDTLEITEEELEELLSVLNLSLLDLFSQDNVKLLIAQQNNSTDLTDFLTDENMLSNFTKLIEQINPVILTEQLNISEEDMGQILEQAVALLEQTEKLPVPENEITAQEQIAVEADDNSHIAVTSDKKEQGKVVEEEPLKEEDTIAAEFKTDVKTAGENKDSFGQQQTEEHSNTQIKSDSIKTQQSTTETESPFQTFIQQLQEHSTSFNEVTGITPSQEMQEIVKQIVEQIKIIIKPEQTSMEMQLNPESLGRVQVSVTQRQGLMTANFVVQNEVAKEAIESQIQLLRDNFQNQGLKVEAVEVTVSNFSFEQSNQSSEQSGQQQSRSARRNLNLSDLEHLSDTLSEEEELAANILVQNGGSIDYTA